MEGQAILDMALDRDMILMEISTKVSAIDAHILNQRGHIDDTRVRIKDIEERVHKIELEICSIKSIDEKVELLAKNIFNLQSEVRLGNKLKSSKIAENEKGVLKSNMFLSLGGSIMSSIANALLIGVIALIVNVLVFGFFWSSK